MNIVALMLRGKMPVVPRFGFGVVNVRDLADLHILAMTHPKAAGERFLAAGEFLWFSEWAQILRTELGEAARRTPRRTLPDWTVCLGAHFSPVLAQLTPNLGVRSRVSTDKAQELLGWQPRPVPRTLVDTARSLSDHHLV